MNNKEIIDEMNKRGDRYFRRQKMWEFVEGLVVAILGVIIILGAMAIL